jgi:uncharacterized cupin superfamily protein
VHPTGPKATAIAPEVVEAADPLYSSNGSEVGFWECSPGVFTARRDDYTEICYVLSGSAIVESTMGGQRTLVSGDTLVRPNGWT